MTVGLGTRLAGVLSILVLLLPALASAQAEDLVFTAAPRALDPSGRQLLDIARAGERIVAVGAAGLIIRSDDNGRTWQQADVPVSATLTAVDFPTPEQGWAVGHAGVILHTGDGGNSWSLQFDGRRANDAFLAWAAEQRAQLEAALQSLEDDAETAASSAAEIEELEYLLEEAIFLEEDAQLAVETGPVDPFLTVDFFDARRGIAAGAYGMLYRTDDGGETWSISLDGIDNVDRFHFYAVYLSPEEEVYLVGEAGLLFRSADGGTSFDRFYDIYDGSLFGVLPLNGDVLAFGLRGNQFVYGADTGDWTPRPTDSESSLYGGTVLADGGMLLLGAGGTLLRIDADGAETVFQHPSRSTFSSALETASGEILLVGMDGLSRFAEARAR